MALLLLFLLALAAQAQPAGNGVPLLRRVSENARSATGWRGEGTIETKGEPALPSRQTFEESRDFKASTRGPLEWRHDLEGLTVCDGLLQWNRRWSGNVWDFRATASSEACDPAVLQWRNLVDSLISAVVTGKDNSSNCTVVAAEYDLPDGLGFHIPMAQPTGIIKREMCIDETRGVILRERFSGISPHARLWVAVGITYTKIERNPQFGPEEFTLPPLTVENIDMLPLNALPFGDSPLPRSMTEP